MTLNGGSSWADIKAPSHFNHKQCDRCGGAKDCSLHLHGESLGRLATGCVNPG
jgi:hypothetical protein